MQIHSDHPTLDDRLNRLESVKLKAAQIVNCKAPQVFGIHGDWGAGKTSYLKQLRYHLDQIDEGVEALPAQNALATDDYKDQVVTVWFDAWRYQHEAAPIIALLQEIRRQFGTWAKIKDKTAKLSSVTVNSLLNGFSDIVKLISLESVSLTPNVIKSAGEAWEKEHLEQRLGVDSVQDFLEKAISEVLSHFLDVGVGEKKLVIIIDDLDRCSPTSAYRLLEGLKVYLSLKNTVFVIGMNQQIIVEAIAANLPQELAQYDMGHKKAAMCIRGEAYLEKLCNHIERLNPPSAGFDFLASFITDPSFKHDLTLATLGINQAYLPPNPRRLKALANVLNLLEERVRRHVTPETTGELCRGLLIAAYIYQFHAELFQRWQFTPSFYSYLIKWAGQPWGDDFALGGQRKWPDYLATLKLPHEIISDGGQAAVPMLSAKTTFPDPYAIDMFWIAPLLSDNAPTEDLMKLILAEIR